jgi:predicted heme/steroid binding protein/uncharacterized membrane protein
MDQRVDEETLAANDGRDGKPTYIAHGDRVVDVSQSPLWADGLHMGRHAAGKDLTSDIEAAPHGTEVLDRYPQVGVLVRVERVREGTVAAPDLPKALQAFLSAHPFFRRHPHPATVHFPIVLVLCTTVFFVLYALTSNASFELSSFYCLIGALLFTPLAILTGLFTWWVNYGARRMLPVIVKEVLSFFTLADLVSLFVWRVLSPQVAASLSGWGLLYLLLVIAASPAVLTVSAFGGQLTFPLRKR